MTAVSTTQHTAEASELEVLIALFDALFASDCNTRLVRGDSEPIYLPADANCRYHRIVFAHGYFASALHEIAHWCIAGEWRRTQVDYGYWYAPDGRNFHQQREFERVEVKPQALEWILTSACGRPFRVSVDNLNGEPTDATPFKQAVHAQVLRYLCNPSTLPARAMTLHRALAECFGAPTDLSEYGFSPAEIGLTTALAVPHG